MRLTSDGKSTSTGPGRSSSMSRATVTKITFTDAGRDEQLIRSAFHDTRHAADRWLDRQRAAA